MAAPLEIEFLAQHLVGLLPTSQYSSNPTLFALLRRKILARFVPKHWHPEQPERGSGYRAISFDHSRRDGYLDPVLSALAQIIGLTDRQLARVLRKQPSWTIWCDPGCVSIRFQSGGGELRELYGRLPEHLSGLVRANNPSPPSFAASPPAQAPGVANDASHSPNKSRAIPILAPSSAVRFAGVTGVAVTPPTPVQDRRDTSLNGGFTEGHNSYFGYGSGELHPSSFVLSRHLSEDDPFLRPCSRTSSASSSSDTSDRSTFSASSSSTATSVSPALVVNRKLSPAHHVTSRAQGAGFIRHHSSSSLPFLSMRPAGPLSVMPFQKPVHFRSDSPTYPQVQAPKRKHGASASVSSLGGGRGLLVLKEGPGTVTEHSGGKVGVMGGGVLLGLPKDKDNKATNKSGAACRKTVNRRVRA